MPRSSKKRKAASAAAAAKAKKAQSLIVPAIDLGIGDIGDTELYIVATDSGIATTDSDIVVTESGIAAIDSGIAAELRVQLHYSLGNAFEPWRHIVMDVSLGQRGLLNVYIKVIGGSLDR